MQDLSLTDNPSPNQPDGTAFSWVQAGSISFTLPFREYPSSIYTLSYTFTPHFGNTSCSAWPKRSRQRTSAAASSIVSASTLRGPFQHQSRPLLSGNERASSAFLNGGLTSTATATSARPTSSRSSSTGGRVRRTVPTRTCSGMRECGYWSIGADISQKPLACSLPVVDYFR